MRILILSSFWVCLSSLSLVGQQSKAGDYLVLYPNDTLFGKVSYLDDNDAWHRFYRKVRIEGENGKRKKFARKLIRSFRAADAVYESFYLIQESPEWPKIFLVNPYYEIDPEKGSHYFLKRIRKDRLSGYELEWIDEDNSSLRSFSLLKKAKDSYLVRADQGIFGLKKKVLFEYFSDCAELQNALEQDEVDRVDQLLEFYNSRCGE
jgi:hypothetical protein